MLQLGRCTSRPGIGVIVVILLLLLQFVVLVAAQLVFDFVEETHSELKECSRVVCWKDVIESGIRNVTLKTEFIWASETIYPYIVLGVGDYVNGTTSILEWRLCAIATKFQGRAGFPDLWPANPGTGTQGWNQMMRRYRKWRK